jgi:predicted TIM-barrel fold metal-dependent hydrolase
VDHHLHLTGPAVTAVLDGPPLLPSVTLPDPLAALLEQRAAAGKDAEALGRLFTDEGVVLGHTRAGWSRSRAEAAALLVSTFGKPYWLLPTGFAVSGRSAHVSGYYARGERGAPAPIGYFFLALQRDDAGAWRIAAEVPKVPLPAKKEVVDASALVRQLDAAGIRQGLVLSEGFWFDGPQIPMPDPAAAVRRENDWTAEQVRAHPDRLLAFCSFNPVAGHALAELARCAADPVFRGVKLGLAMSGVDLKDPAQVERVRQVFAAANGHRLPIVIHLRSGPDYDATHVQVFLEQVLPAAPDIAVQVAHLWGGEAYSEAALAAFAQAFRERHPSTRNLYFDVAEMWLADAPGVQAAAAGHMRTIGMERILFGSDGKVSPQKAWQAFRAAVPLTESEFRTIAGNTLPVPADRARRE